MLHISFDPVLACLDSYRRATCVVSLLHHFLGYQSYPLILTAHKCPKCDDKRFSRTSNLYRHMRTCKGTASSKSPADEAFRSQVRLANASKSAASEGAPSSRSTSPAPSVSSYPPSSPLQEYSLDSVRGISPDPNWGPNPLASWQPSKRRHTLASFPMPISQRVYFGNLPPHNNVNNNVGPSPTMTPSPSSPVSIITTKFGTPPAAVSESRTSVSAQDNEAFLLQQRHQPASGAQSLVARSPAPQDHRSRAQSIPSGHASTSINSIQPGGGGTNFDLVSPALLGASAYNNDLVPPSPSHWSTDGLSIAMTDGEALRYLLMTKNTTPGWTPSPPHDPNALLIGMDNAGDIYAGDPCIVDSQEDAVRREQDAQGESFWNAYVNLE